MSATVLEPEIITTPVIEETLVVEVPVARRVKVKKTKKPKKSKKTKGYKIVKKYPKKYFKKVRKVVRGTSKGAGKATRKAGTKIKKASVKTGASIRSGAKKTRNAGVRLWRGIKSVTGRIARKSWDLVRLGGRKARAGMTWTGRTLLKGIGWIGYGASVAYGFVASALSASTLLAVIAVVGVAAGILWALNWFVEGYRDDAAYSKWVAKGRKGKPKDYRPGKSTRKFGMTEKRRAKWTEKFASLMLGQNVQVVADGAEQVDLVEYDFGVEDLQEVYASIDASDDLSDEEKEAAKANVWEAAREAFLFTISPEEDPDLTDEERLQMVARFDAEGGYSTRTVDAWLRKDDIRMDNYTGMTLPEVLERHGKRLAIALEENDMAEISFWEGRMYFLRSFIDDESLDVATNKGLDALYNAWKKTQPSKATPTDLPKNEFRKGMTVERNILRAMAEETASVGGQ